MSETQTVTCEVGFLFLPRGSPGWNSGHPPWCHASLPTAFTFFYLNVFRSFFYVYILPTCIECAPHLCLVPGVQKRALDPGTGDRDGCEPPVGAGNQMETLYKS